MEYPGELGIKGSRGVGYPEAQKREVSILLECCLVRFIVLQLFR